MSCAGRSVYVFPSVASTGLTSVEFAEQLLLEEKVAVVPGSVFGESGEGFIRCSYATSLEQLMEAMKRMERFVENKKGQNIIRFVHKENTRKPCVSILSQYWRIIRATGNFS